MEGRQFQFEWDEGKARQNVRKHGVSFELARTVFHDPHLLTVADLEHSEFEEGWASIGLLSNGALLSVVYLWLSGDSEVAKVRLISARRATLSEIRYYQVGIHE